MKRMQRQGRPATVAAFTLALGILAGMVAGDARSAGAPTSQPAGGATSRPALPTGHPGAAAKPATPVVGAPGRPIDRSKPTPVKSLSLRAFHRVFHDFAEDETVPMFKEFGVGDTDFTAEVVEFLPDFFMDLKTHAVSSRSDEPKNPAIRVLVRQKGVPQDTTWAMLNLPPHFARKSMLAFQILRIDLKGRKPILAPEPKKPDASNATPGGASKS